MLEKQVSVRARFTNSTHVASSSKNDDRDQLKLNRNVALCAAEVLIPFSALSSPAFDRLVKDIDSHLAVRFLAVGNKIIVLQNLVP